MLEKLEYVEEAKFCHAMADWLSAHDDRGIKGTFNYSWVRNYKLRMCGC